MQPSNAPRIPVLICIDIEPQRRAGDLQKGRNWAGFPETWECVDNLRPSLEAATRSPVRFNWFLRMDPQVSEASRSADWVVTRYRSIFDRILLAQDELGLHPHAWRLDQETLEWCEDFGNQRWVEKCVTQSFDQFERAFGRPCRSIRFGARWLNNRTVGLVERMGAQFDLTVEPGGQPERIEHSTGSFPDFTSAPRLPYHPSRWNYMRPGRAFSARKICMIPLSTVDPHRSLRGPRSGAPIAPAEDHRARSRKYQGYLDFVTQRWIIGWLYDSEHPDDTVSVDVFDDGRFVGSYAANAFRHDLLLAGKGSGAHAFYIPLPQAWRDGRLHSIGVKAAGSDFELFQSPKELRLKKHSSSDYWTMNLSENSDLFAGGLDALLVEEKSPYLSIVLRTDAITTQSGRAYLDRNLESLISHPLAANFVFTTPGEAVRLLQSQQL